MRSKYEKLAQEELEKAGFKVDNKAGMAHWAKNRDFWNRFDLVALPPDRSRIYWISIKGRAGVPAAHLKEVTEFKLPKGNIKEIWSRKKKRRQAEMWNKIIVP